MKKQFNRMRQLANQTVGRAEKTEVLSEDLLQVEKRLELVKQVSHSTHKKLTACLQGQQGAEADKRSKKLPLTTLAQCLMEGSAILGDDTLLGKMLKLCGETEDKLAQELIHFELQVERDVIEPLFLLAEVEIPNIQKQRKHLAKLVLDMDSSRTRWQQTSKSSGLSSSLQPAGAKADALREEMEEAANRVEICRDQLSADMYSFVAKEIDYANYFQTLIEVQAEYHRKSLTLLQAVLPQIKAQQEAWVEKPSFGKPLEEHLTISGREIAFPIEACVTMLLECGMQEEGLFRVAPSASKLKKLKAALDCCVVDVQEYSADPHAIAGALKSYLRELPEPLMTFELYDEWIQASNIQEQDKKLQALWNACEKLPKANHNNIRYLIKFLSKLSEYQDVNKMTPSNMAIVLGPNLLWPQAEGNITEMMTTVSLQIVGIIEPIIQHADWFFPGEIEFNITGNYGSPVHVNHNANYSSMPSPDMDPADRRQPEQARRPLSVATDNMMLEFYKKDGLRKIQSMGVRVMDTNWVARRGSSAGRKASCAPPSMQPPAPPAELAAPLPSPLPEQPLDSPAAPALSPSGLGLQPGPERTSTTKSKELSPGSAQKGSPGSSQGTACAGTQPGAQPGAQPGTSPSPSQPPADQSPHTLRKVSKKLAPIPPKVPFGQPGAVADQSAGQPSPVSLSPTPPSTPSPYGLSYPQGYSLASGQLSPAAAPPLASPSVFTSTLSKSRPTPKPRQRPTLPPPQPPTVNLSASSPQSTEPPMLDGMSPGESMSTDLVHFDIPSIHIELGSTLRLSPLEHMRRHSVTDKRDSEEESESTAL
ncbi:rho GTPase-activating protein 44 isoform X1 [Chlorocebus sabaeus]|uniref:Rho GTPase-activating protein 44 n=3 Tax=Cercopithecinae TaxID=9528 RepID=A0A2K5M1L1_CERAT|nr:rho GTPase-activating protein 44 isoform X1 [Papio anubis]XP_008008611.1 rho GTPase-activating protein 44 isoform X1 [Chlorocebus sabaeus]XP_011905803.1 PREDICTED: rho GTPase-activating protein 44 isoform X1 [Cercocebus atys]XP_025219416.1 rho GTPase-activating protein 44 isoform X1 [Theropithecus gelada]